jgi:LuxR family transcriptional regulator, quorum-sensing system regulator BjaR1
MAFYIVAPVSRPLSEREVLCLYWLAEGELDYAIGIRLSISARTVRFHIDRAKQALGAKSRLHAVALALRANMLTDDSGSVII